MIDNSLLGSATGLPYISNLVPSSWRIPQVWRRRTKPESGRASPRAESWRPSKESWCSSSGQPGEEWTPVWCSLLPLAAKVKVDFVWRSDMDMTNDHWSWMSIKITPVWSSSSHTKGGTTNSLRRAMVTANQEKVDQGEINKNICCNLDFELLVLHLSSSEAWPIRYLWPLYCQMPAEHWASWSSHWKANVICELALVVSEIHISVTILSLCLSSCEM